MPHDEYLELIERGESALFDQYSELANFVDDHVRVCDGCQALAFELLWARCRSNPLKFGPVRTLLTAHYYKQHTNRFKQENWKRHSPIARIANTIVMDGIKDNAVQIKISARLNENISTEQHGLENDRPKDVTETANIDLRTAILDDVITGTSYVQVEELTVDGWTSKLTMPGYIIPSLILQYKEFANLWLSETGVGQRGEFPINYDEQPYKVLVETIPDELCETVTLSLSAG